LIAIARPFPASAAHDCAYGYWALVPCSRSCPESAAVEFTRYRCNGEVLRVFDCGCDASPGIGVMHPTGACEQPEGPDSCGGDGNQNGCSGDGCLIAPNPSQAQCTCPAACEASDCDSPPTATCTVEDVEPVETDEVCGDEKDNTCGGAIDRCEPPGEKQPLAGERDATVCAGLLEDVTVVGADPILLEMKAAVTEPFTDFSAESIVNLSITRTYTSADVSVRVGSTTAARSFGAGWRHDWELSVACADSTWCRVSQGVSGATEYRRAYAAEAIAPYSGETWVIYLQVATGRTFGAEHGVLARRPSGDFIWFRRDGREFHFGGECGDDSCGANDPFCKDPWTGGRARLSKVVDARGNAIRVGYDRPRGIVLSLSDEVGHTLELRASGNACTSPLARTLTYDGVPYLTYEYGASSLAVVRQWAANGAGSIVRSYEYAPDRTLTRIRNESGDPIVEFGYDSRRYATSLVDPESSLSVSYSVSASVTEATVTSAASSEADVVTYELNRHVYSCWNGNWELYRRCKLERAAAQARAEKCRTDAKGRWHVFEPDGRGRVARHAVYPPASPSQPLVMDRESFECEPAIRETLVSRLRVRPDDLPHDSHVRLRFREQTGRSAGLWLQRRRRAGTRRPMSRSRRGIYARHRGSGRSGAAHDVFLVRRARASHTEGRAGPVVARPSAPGQHRPCRGALVLAGLRHAGRPSASRQATRGSAVRERGRRSSSHVL
jgi:hypothetical protein